MNKRYPRFEYSPDRDVVNGRMKISYFIDNASIVKPEFCFDSERFNESKTFTKRDYLKNIPFVSRLSFIDSISCEELYASAIEELNKTDVPETARHYRTIALELSRISAFFLNVFNVSSALEFEIAKNWSLSELVRTRTLIKALKQNEYFAPFIIPGGVRCPILSKNMKMIEKDVDLLENKLNDFDKILFQNEFFRVRTSKVGKAQRRMVEEYGITGPTARAANISFDLRRRLPYEVYRKEYAVNRYYEDSDVYNRLLCRRNEVSDSIMMIRKILTEIPNESVYINRDSYEKGKITVKPGIVLKRVEGVNGEFVCLLESDGSPKPLNVKFRSPMYALSGDFLKNLIEQSSIDDIDLVLASLFLSPMEMYT
ncbi:MAG: hypothetical protein PHW02_00930 [bacterium]|nr:hypothetical protein [bacterium]